MSEKLPSPDVLVGVKEGPKEQSDRVLYSDFEQSLDELKFDEQQFLDAMFKALSDSKPNSFVMLKWHIGGAEAAEGRKPITREDFEVYFDSTFTKEFPMKAVFDRGVNSLRDDFKFQQRRFAGYTEVLKGGKVANEKIRVAGRNGMMEIKTRAQALEDSGIAKRIRDLSAGVGKPATEVTFEDAFDNKFYNSYLQPSMLGVAEYGLTWMEYRSKGERNLLKEATTASLSKQSEDVASDILKTEKGPELVTKGSDLVSMMQNRYEFLKFALKDRPGVQLKLSESGGKKLPSIDIYKDNKLVLKLEFGKNREGDIVAVARDSRLSGKDVEHVGNQSKELDSLIWFVNYKLDHLDMGHKQLTENFARIVRLRSMTPALKKMFESNVKSSSFGTEYGEDNIVFSFGRGADSLKLRVKIDERDETAYEFAKGDGVFQPLSSHAEMVAKIADAIKVKEVAGGVSEAEAKRRGDIVFDEETGIWKPKPGMEYRDKNRNRVDFSVQYRPEYREAVDRAEPKLRGVLNEKIAAYGAAGKVLVSAPESDAYGHPVIKLSYEGKELMRVEIRVYLATNKPSYRLSVGNKQVDLGELAAVGTRVDNLLKRRLVIEKK